MEIEAQKPKVERKENWGKVSKAGMKHATVAKHVETHLTVLVHHTPNV